MSIQFSHIRRWRVTTVPIKLYSLFSDYAKRNFIVSERLYNYDKPFGSERIIKEHYNLFTYIDGTASSNFRLWISISRMVYRYCKTNIQKQRRLSLDNLFKAEHRS